MALPKVSTLWRHEKIADITINNTNAAYTLPTQGGLLPSDRFMTGILLEVEFRVTNPATGTPTGTQGDAPYSILNLISVTGKHRIRGQQEPFINVRGVDMRQLVGSMNQRFPYSSGSSLSITASATNDVRFFIFVPFIPLNMPVTTQIGYLLDAPNYDNLQLVLNWGDDKQLFTGQTTAPTFSAYGSASGTPRIRVSAFYAMGGKDLFAGFVPARVWRWFQENTSSTLTTTTTNQRIHTIPTGYFIRNILLKTGVKSASITSGNDCYNSLSNSILTNMNLFQGSNKTIRDYVDMFTLQEDSAEPYRITPDVGYGLIDFASHGNPGEVLNTTNLVAGPTGNVDLYLGADVAGANGQAALALYEEWRGNPIFGG